MTIAKVASRLASRNCNNTNRNSSNNRSSTSSNISNSNSTKHSRHIHIRTTKVRTAGSSPTTRQPARLEFDIMKTPCLGFNTARDHHRRTLLADTLDAVLDLRLGLVMGSRRVSHLADNATLRTLILDLGTIDHLDISPPRLR